METKNQTAQESARSGVVDYAAALRQYHRYGRGSSMKKFCEDEGYDYWKFCKLAREGQSEMDAKIYRWGKKVLMPRSKPSRCTVVSCVHILTHDQRKPLKASPLIAAVRPGVIMRRRSRLY